MYKLIWDKNKKETSIVKILKVDRCNFTGGIIYIYQKGKSYGIANEVYPIKKYRIGDIVEYDGVLGKVTKINPLEVDHIKVNVNKIIPEKLSHKLFQYKNLKETMKELTDTSVGGIYQPENSLYYFFLEEDSNFIEPDFYLVYLVINGKLFKPDNSGEKIHIPDLFPY